MCWFARLAISVMVTLMTIAATVEQARAQRLRGPEPWAYERYASNKDDDPLPASMLSVWNATLKEWDIRDTFCLANVDPEVTPLGDTTWIGLKRPPDAPNYDMNYENVVFMSAGRFYGDQDTTLNGETTFTTPIPSIVLLQHGRLGHDEKIFTPNVRVLQIFTVESRPFRVLDPLNFNHLEGQRYRRDTTEGLGVVLNAQGRVVSSKYNIMVDSAQTQHPTVLRYDDRSLDATRVRGVAVADLTGDVRDEVVLFYDSGTDTRVIRLSNDSALGHGKPMDYIFTRHNDATVAYAALDVRDLRHAVAGRFIVGTDTVRQVVLFLRDANNAQRIVVARPGTPWTFTEVATPLTTVLDFDALDGVVRTDLDGDGVDEIAFVERRYGSTDVGRIVSGATWTVEAAADRYTLSPQVAAAGRVTAVGGGDVDGDGTDEVVLASRRNNSSNDATLVVVRRQGTTWSDTTSVRADGAHLDGTQVRRLVVANLDYDVRRRGDVAVLYHGDPSASECDDRLLLWRSLPRHADNDYTLDVDTGQGRQPFIPLGWFGIRLSTGLTPRPTPDVIHLTDNWRKLHVWWGPEDQQRRSGYRYIPDSGRIGDALLQDYASIYNTIISERQDYTDGYIFAGRNDNLLDAGSTLYYHNLNECRDGLLETIGRANDHNLMVMPYMGFHLPHTYDLRNDSTRQWHSWRTTQAGAAAGTLPQFSRTLMDPAVQNHRRFLGWYGADEPTGLLYNTHWTEFQRAFSPGLLPPAPPRATLRDTLRAFYRSVRWRSIDHPVFMNYHMPLDYEYYRNCHDVAMVDCYVHRAQYELTNQTVGNVERASNRRRTDTDPPAPAAEGLQWSLNPRMRGLMQHVIRTDKVAAIHIGQGAGEDYTGVDVDHSTNPPTTLRAYPEYRNLTHDETRYLLFAPAALGIRGALWWQGTTWMAGSAAAHQHVADPGYQLVGPRDAQGNVMLNSLGEPIHPARHSNTMTAQQKFRIDRASAEFRNYLPILMNEALDGRVSTSSHLAGAGWHNTDVVTSLHLDSATGRYWLFVVNMSDRTFENLAISVAGIPNSLHLAPVGPDDWIDGRVDVKTLGEMERADGTVRFTTPLTGFDVRIFVFTAFRPTFNRTTREIKGELAWANQRKLVVYPTHRPGALGSVPDSTSDSVRYHLVYMRSDCDTCGPLQSQHRVYYRRSQPMSEYSSRSNVEWEPLEHALSTAVVDHRDSAEPKALDSSLTCGYPSIVVRYDSLLGRSRVHVVYACHSANPTDMVFQHIETGEEGTIRIVEHVFDADAPMPAILAGEVIGAAYGNTIHDYGFPVIGAGTQRNGYVWSCRDRGIVAGMKPSNEVTFSQANPFWAITGSNANGVGPVMNDNHPGMTSYALPTNGTDEFPFVWTSGAMSSQVNYSRMRWQGNTSQLYAPSPAIDIRRLSYDHPGWILGYPSVIRVHTHSNDPLLDSGSRERLDAWNAKTRHDRVVYSQVRVPGGWNPGSLADRGSVVSRALVTEDADGDPRNDAVIEPAVVTYVHKFRALHQPSFATPMVSHLPVDTTKSRWQSLLHTPPKLVFVAADTDSNAMYRMPYDRATSWPEAWVYSLSDSLRGGGDPAITNVYWMRFDTASTKWVSQHLIAGAQPNQAARPRHGISTAFQSTRLVVEQDTGGRTPGITANAEPYFIRPDRQHDDRDRTIRDYVSVMQHNGITAITDLRIGGAAPVLMWDARRSVLATDTVTVNGPLRGSMVTLLSGRHAKQLVLRRVDAVTGEAGLDTTVLVSLQALPTDREQEVTFTAMVTPGRYVIEMHVDQGQAQYLRVIGSGTSPVGSTGKRTFDKSADSSSVEVAVREHLLPDEGIHVYPVPATSTVTVTGPSSTSAQAESTLTVLTTDGRQMYQSTGAESVRTIDVALWPSGSYAIRWSSGNKSYTATLMIAR